jgi:S1-C subfamily serine protease
MEDEGTINNENNNQPNITVTQEEKVVIDVVKNSTPSVVSIAVSQVTLRRGEGLVDEVSNIGTGFIVDPNGIIVTNQHVVSDISATYKVITSDGKEFEIVEIVRDDNNDIAILKVDATQLPVLELGDSDNLVVGQTVIAIGTPLGEYAGSVTTGVISGTNRTVTATLGWFGSTTKTYEDVIQTDAAINSGNSGGPLISTEGEVIGINFATTANADNISFALPINVVKQRLEEYRVYGKFIKPYVGISYQMISQYQALYYTDVVAGALVMNIDLEGPASKVDIKRGDIIVKVNEKEVVESLASIIQSYKVGDELTLEVWREDKTHTVKVTLAEAD